MSENPTTIPADLFGDTPILCRGAPASWRGPLYHPVLVTEIRTFAGERTAYVLDGEKPQRVQWSELDLDLTQEIGQQRLCVVVSSGKRCTTCGGTGTIGTGWLRKPAPAWHLLPKALGGTLPDEYAAHTPALLSCHAARVAAGQPGLVVLFPYRVLPEGITRYRDDGGPLLSVCKEGTAEVGRGWWFKLAYADYGATAAGPENGEAGKLLADAAALAAGYALIDGETLRLPEVPDAR